MVHFLNYLLFFIVDIGLLIGAGFAYTRTTPFDEIRLIRAPGGNTAAAIGLAGTMIGFAVVLYSATQRADIFGTIMWAIIALVVQVAAFQLLRRFIMRDGWKDRIENNDLSHGVILGAFSLAVGVINAGCIT